VIDRERDRDVLAEIEAENEKFLRLQSVFRIPVIKAVLKCDNPAVLVPYFFNVFARSSHVAFADEFARHVLEVVANKRDEGIGALFVDRVDEIKDILTQCSSAEIRQACLLILNGVLAKVPRLGRCCNCGTPLHQFTRGSQELESFGGLSQSNHSVLSGKSANCSRETLGFAVYRIYSNCFGGQIFVCS
jgi:hypothetical protein